MISNYPVFFLFLVRSSPSEYDLRMKYYLERLEKEDILNNTVVVFFSDHGMRFGEIRKYFTGWLEERMPYLFIWLPEKFKQDHPEYALNLKVNENRLTSPFDLHITIKHVLKLSGQLSHEASADSCDTCQSLFDKVPLNRTCSDAGVDKVWCTCTDFEDTDYKSKTVKKVAHFAVQKLNDDLSKLKECAKLKLSYISSARKSRHNSTIDYLVSFNVSPSKGQMEATIRCTNEDCLDMNILGEISRINEYGSQSKCISDAILRKYCYCT